MMTGHGLELEAFSGRIRLPFASSGFAQGKLIAEAAAEIPKPQESEDMISMHRGIRKALGRTITYQDIPVEPWRDGLLERGLPVHLVDHLATMAIYTARDATTGCRLTCSC